MTTILVKTAAGCRLRDPKTQAVLPSIDDADSTGFEVDLDDPHWFRAQQCGDIVEVKVLAGNTIPAPIASDSPVVPAAPAVVPAAAPAVPAAAAAAPMPPLSK
jgi:hypothetical protein